MRGLILPGWAGQRQRSKWGRTLLLALAVVIFVVPILWSLLASLNVLPDESHTPPTWLWHPDLENYLDIGTTTPTFFQALAGSVITAITATALTAAVALLAAYSLARSRFSRVGILVPGLLILASVPVMAFVIPLEIVVRAMHLYDTASGVVLANSAFFTPLAVYILYGYVRQIPLELEEAAHLEGANIWQTIWQVVLPLLASGIAATAIVVFVLNWNMLLIPLALSESRVKTIPIIVSGFFFLEREIDWPSAAAMLISSLIPLVILVAAAHRALERFSLIPTQQVT